MKIAYILPALTNTGPTIVINTLIKNISAGEHQIEVFYFDDKPAINFSCPTYRIDFNSRIDFEKYDIVHSNGYRPDKYVAKWKKSVKGNVKFVSTIHQDIFHNLKYSYNLPVAIVFSKIWSGFLKKMDATFAISKKLQTLYINRFKNCNVVYNGVDVEYNPQDADCKIASQIEQFRSSNDLKVIGLYAAINKGKGIDQLIKILPLRNDIGLVIIGEGVERERLKEFCFKNGYDNRVLFLPYLKGAYNYVGFFDCYAMPSRNEGFGLAMAEAALCRVPVVCSDIDVFREIFDDSQAAFFELENIDSLSMAIDKAIKNRDLLIENAYKRITENFTGKIMANNYLKLYKELIKDNAEI